MRSALLIISTVVGFTYAQMCSKNTVYVSGKEGTVQCDYDHQLSDHFSQNGNTYRFWGHLSDNPHSKKSGTDRVRTEITLSKHSFDWNSVMSFEGKFRVPSYVQPNFIIFQIFNKNGSKGSMTSIHLTATNNNLQQNYGGGQVYKHGIKSDDPNFWTHVKVTFQNGTMKVYVDYRHVDTLQATSGVGPYYFKFGAYAQKTSNTKNQQNKYEVIWTDVHFKKNSL